MAIGVSITGTTAGQNSTIGDAFDMIPGRTELGLTKAQWVERLLVRHIKAVVKGYRRSVHEASIATEQTQVDVDFPEA